MRRLAAVCLLAVIVVAAACSDQKLEQPTAPAAAPGLVPAGRPAASLAGQASDSTAIESLIYQLYNNLNNGNGPYNSADTRFQQIAQLFTNCTLNPPQSPCDQSGAVSNTYLLITDILSKYQSGQLNDLSGYSSPSGTGTGAAVTDLVNLLFQYVGVNATICSFAVDCNATVYQPGSPAQILTTPSGQAGISLPPGTGTVTQPTVISVSRIVDPTVRLTTQLDQYTYRYLYTSSSGEGSLPSTPFLQPVTVEVCLEPGQVYPPGAFARLALAHDVAEPPPYQNIQILPAASGFLGTCNALSLSDPLRPTLARGWRGALGRLASLLAPPPLQALAVTTGTTGTTKTLSPFGAVDTLGFITPNAPTSSSAPEGGTAPAPSVRVVSPSELAAANPTGPGMAGIPVTFTVTAGGGCFANPCTPSSPTTLVVTTDAQGYASVPAWTVGLGSNTVTATAAIPCTAPVAAGTAQDCGTILTTALAPAQSFSATGNPPVKLSFSVQPVTTTAGAAFGVTVLAQDVNGNTVPAFTAPAYNNAQVSLALNAGNGASLGGTTMVSAVGGLATFSGLSVTRAGTGYTITASATGLTSATSNPFSILAGPAAAIAINAGNGQTAVEGSTLGVTAGTVAPQVRVSDGYGNPVAGAGVSFVVASGAGSVGSPSATTNAAGLANTTWTIVAGSNTLDANITALGPLPVVTFTATGTSATTVLVDCAPAQGNGDELSRAFYVNKLGKTIKQVTLYLASNDPANVPTPYQIQLIASPDSYGATPIGTSTVTAVLRGSASQNLATRFVFPSTPIPPGTKNVAFQFRVLSNPNGAKLYFALSSGS
ncbi:MAG TPA: hypothetical protein VNH46_12290, partial [Gemmatimonadales bacterium]|nr:hypothetical protein [Gemmatimonadales bacterium]